MDAGGDSLLKLPQIDVAIKVFRGGGLEESVTDTFYGVTGKPVARHQFSLLERPPQSAKLRVYKGGGMETFRGKSLSDLQSKGNYESLVTTGKVILEKTTVKGDDDESLKKALDACEVYFYGEEGLFAFDYKSQVLLFSTTLKPITRLSTATATATAPAPPAAAALAEGDAAAPVAAPIPAPVAAAPAAAAPPAAAPPAAAPPAAALAEGDAAAPPAAAPVAEADAPAAPVADAPAAVVHALADAVVHVVTAGPTPAPAPIPDPEDAAEGTVGILVLTVTDGKWTLSVPEAVAETIDMPPYIIRDPSELTAEEFFSTLTKSEVLYMSDVIFKGYPLRQLRDVLTKERKEEFFEKVWKPLIDQRITGSLTLKYDPELEGAKAYIGELRQAQIKLLEEHIEQFLIGQGKEIEEDEQDDSEGEEEDANYEEGEKKEVIEENNAEGEKEEVIEEKNAEGEKVDEEKKAGKKEEAPAQPKIKATGFQPKRLTRQKTTPVTAPQAEPKQKKQLCSSLAKDTTPDEFVQYIRALYNLILQSKNGMPIEIDPYITRLEEIILKAPNTVPALEIKSNVQPLITELKRVKGEMQKNKGTRRRSQGALTHTLIKLTESLKDIICKYYAQITALNPGSPPKARPVKGEKRVTQKKQRV